MNFESVKESYDDEDGFQWGSGASKETAATKAKWRKAIFDNFGRTNSLTFTHVYDNRDNYFNASKGRRLSFRHSGADTDLAEIMTSTSSPRRGVFTKDSVMDIFLHSV